MYLNKFICVYISIYFYIYIFTYMFGYGSAYLDWSGPMGMRRWGWGDGGGPMGAGLGIRSFDFQENRSFFVQK